MLYLIYCTDKPNHQDVRMAYRAAHIEYLKAVMDKLVIGGPILSPDGQSMIGSMLVIDAANQAEIDEFTKNDPYSKAQLFESVVVRPYKKVFPA